MAEISHINHADRQPLKQSSTWNAFCLGQCTHIQFKYCRAFPSWLQWHRKVRLREDQG